MTQTPTDTGCPPHCCCCDHCEPCCDCGQIMPSKACVGETCWCGKPAAKKVGEEILFDDPMPNRHNLTRYICAEHYAQLMGPLGAKQVGIAALPDPAADEEDAPWFCDQERLSVLTERLTDLHERTTARVPKEHRPTLGL